LSKAAIKVVGKVIHYYNKIGVAIVELRAKLAVGDEIGIEGANTSFRQTVESMQIEHEIVEKAGKGQSIGLKVIDRCRKGDRVYIIR
jgi:putative protease